MPNSPSFRQLLMLAARRLWTQWCDDALVSHGQPSRRLRGRRPLLLTAFDRAIWSELHLGADPGGDSSPP
jgi:hypothetical protein